MNGQSLCFPPNRSQESGNCRTYRSVGNVESNVAHGVVSTKRHAVGRMSEWAAYGNALIGVIQGVQLVRAVEMARDARRLGIAGDVARDVVPSDIVQAAVILIGIESVRVEQADCLLVERDDLPADGECRSSHDRSGQKGLHCG